MDELNNKKVSGKEDEPTTSDEVKQNVSGDRCRLETKTENADGDKADMPFRKVSRQTPRRRKRARSARDVFAENEVLAATVIVEMMTSESSSNSLKVDCAKEVLTRLHGKTFEEVTATDLRSIIPGDLLEFCD